MGEFMANYFYVNGKRYVVTDCDTIIREEGSRLESEELYGSGYISQLSARINEINKKLQEEEAKKKAKQLKAQEAEPNV